MGPKAYAKYQEGIRLLLESLPEAGPSALETEETREQRERLDQYLKEAERLQVIVTIEQRLGSSSSRSQATVEDGREAASLDAAASCSEALCKEAFALENWGLHEQAREKGSEGL